MSRAKRLIESVVGGHTPAQALTELRRRAPRRGRAQAGSYSVVEVSAVNPDGPVPLSPGFVKRTPVLWALEIPKDDTQTHETIVRTWKALQAWQGPAERLSLRVRRASGREARDYFWMAGSPQQNDLKKFLRAIRA